MSLNVDSRVEGKTKKNNKWVGTIKNKKKEGAITKFHVKWDNGGLEWVTIRSIAKFGARRERDLWNPDIIDRDDEEEAPIKQPSLFECMGRRYAR
jgi:hypothetical protein